MKVKHNLGMFLIIALITAYAAINLATLTRFPFVHSDEAWLSGLSRNILEKGDYSVTEAFFDLKDRYPHAIKILFHTLQIIFIKLMGYSIFTFRFISLIFGLLCLVLMYKLSKLIFPSRLSAWSATILLALDIQFIYASHFARQEIIILFMLLLGLWYKFKHSDDVSLKHDIILGCIIGLSIGIHPNSFIIALPFGFIYLYEIFFTKKQKLMNLLALIGTVTCFAALFVGISLYLDPDFISHYSKYGSEFEVFNPLSSKVEEIKLFYQKLYYRVSGTYYTPNIKLQFYLFSMAFVLSIIKLFAGSDAVERKRKLISIVLSIAAINTGIIIIGRFNQTSVILMFPMFYILIAYLLESLPQLKRYIAICILIAAIAGVTTLNYKEYRSSSYEKYIGKLASVVSPNAVTLGNLNTEYYFENGRLHDYRNLAYLKQKGMSFEEYIRSNNIEYIVYSEELDLIHQLQPKWNGIYGPMDYYDEMNSFIDKNCKLVAQYSDDYYGIRIVRYIGLKAWQIRIYKVM